jgi:mannitol/fructose-specific phosphotransferase system IIA component (Ntr-type)
MNQRIRELAEECENWYEVADEMAEMVFDVEKFTQLIVQEMLMTCEEHPTWTGRMIGEQIKQHFGVAE